MWSFNAVGGWFIRDLCLVYEIGMTQCIAYFLRFRVFRSARADSGCASDVAFVPAAISMTSRRLLVYFLAFPIKSDRRRIS